MDYVGKWFSNALNYLYNRLSGDQAKYFLGAIGVILAAIFSVVQWVLPLWWERQPNFDVSFIADKNGIFIQTVPLDEDPEQCLITGTVNIKNDGAAPISIQNTHIVFLPYDVKKCASADKLCVAQQNIPTDFIGADQKLVDTKLKKLVSEHLNTTIYPVTREHQLFSGSNATRVFSVLIPITQMQKERMLVLAQQEFGGSDCTPFESEASLSHPLCASSRATINIPFPCKSPQNKSKIDGELSKLVEQRKKFQKMGVTLNDIDKRINELILERINAPN
jgi:hypothetical protein